MSDRLYKPGARGRARRYGRISDERIAWVKTTPVELFLMQYPDGGDDPDAVREVGDSFVVVVGQPGRKPATINFSNMTSEELKLVREFLNLSMDLAEPVAAARDKAAEEAANEGDDTYARNYRPVPQLHRRQGAFTPDGSCVRNGLEDLPEGGPRDGDRAGGVRGVRDVVAPVEPSYPEAEDDAPAED